MIGTGNGTGIGTGSESAIVVGGGIFGVTAALELARRGYSTRLIDPGPIPHVDASSTDISKLVRLEYGSDVFYSACMEDALEGWRAWNDTLFSTPLFHETGVAFLTREPMVDGSFELASLRTLARPRRIRAQHLHRRVVAAHRPFVRGRPTSRTNPLRRHPPRGRT